MDWTCTLSAALGRSDALARLLDDSENQDQDLLMLATLALTSPAPPPATALATATAAIRSADGIAPLLVRAFRDSLREAIAAWRQDATWPHAAVGCRAPFLLWRMARILRYLYDPPARAADADEHVGSGVGAADAATIADAVAIVLRDGDVHAVCACIESLDAPAWRTLDEAQRAALFARGSDGWVYVLGAVWTGLAPEQRARVVRFIESERRSQAPFLVGRIGAAAWRRTEPALRQRLIGVVVHEGRDISACAPAWHGMLARERDRVVAAMIAQNNAWDAWRLLEDIGADGRTLLAGGQRRSMDQLIAKDYPWASMLIRAADKNREWIGLPHADRCTALQKAEMNARLAAELLHAVGVAGWTAMRDDERARVLRGVRRARDGVFWLPPAFWKEAFADSPPPLTACPAPAAKTWRIDGALGDLSPPYRALALALAPWTDADLRGATDRMAHLTTAWRATDEATRLAAISAHPQMPAAVAAAARLLGDRAAGNDVFGCIVAAATQDGVEADLRGRFFAGLAPAEER